MNPVVLTLGFFTTLFGGAGVWAFATALINRKADLKQKDSNTTKTLEEVSAAFRKEIREENKELKAEMREMKDAFIILVDTIDEWWGKLTQNLNTPERKSFREKVNEARKLT